MKTINQKGNVMEEACLNEYGVRDFNYYSLVRKSDGKEAYTSPDYEIENTKAADLTRVESVFNWYFDRVNSSVEQQLQSLRLSDEQKKSLKKLETKDYVVKYKKFTPIGMAEKVFWTKELNDFLGT